MALLYTVHPGYTPISFQTHGFRQDYALLPSSGSGAGNRGQGQQGLRRRQHMWNQLEPKALHKRNKVGFGLGHFRDPALPAHQSCSFIPSGVVSEGVALAQNVVDSFSGHHRLVLVGDRLNFARVTIIMSRVQSEG
ncbi:hypothetical protein RSAG8_02607, partial [Rhizoctonia solani AG-8 WAC10335]